MRKNGIEPEFCDADHLVLMFTPSLGLDAVARLQDVFDRLPCREAVTVTPPRLSSLPRSVMSIRTAVMSPCEVIDVDNCVGKIAACVTVGCPPAVPILVCGEKIDDHAIKCFAYYGITECCVVK